MYSIFLEAFHNHVNRMNFNTHEMTIVNQSIIISIYITIIVNTHAHANARTHTHTHASTHTHTHTHCNISQVVNTYFKITQDNSQRLWQ
jgi:hypothetical protein